MKTALATLLLLFQLQPLVGSAACALFSDRPSEPTCEMPEQRPPAHASVLQGGSASPDCALGFVCARSTIAAPSFTGDEESTTPLHLAAAPSPAGTLTGIASAPPFHPPKA
jgi:hypothetical protein